DKTATFKMEDFEGQNVPIRKGRTNIYVNRIKSVVDTVPAAYFTRLLMLLVSKSLLPAL
ncbi:major capsid protein, partial [Escherichia coli ECA-0157]